MIVVLICLPLVLTFTSPLLMGFHSSKHFSGPLFRIMATPSWYGCHPFLSTAFSLSCVGFVSAWSCPSTFTDTKDVVDCSITSLFSGFKHGSHIPESYPDLVFGVPYFRPPVSGFLSAFIAGIHLSLFWWLWRPITHRSFDSLLMQFP